MPAIKKCFRISNPRKGTETRVINPAALVGFGFRISNPRKGTETLNSAAYFYQQRSFRISNPRKGTETCFLAPIPQGRFWFPHI